jgi:hypothetical protein
LGRLVRSNFKLGLSCGKFNNWIEETLLCNQIICKQKYCKQIYFSYMHLSFMCGILCEWNSGNLKKIPKLQKKSVVRLIANILYTNMYLSRFITDSVFHSYDTRNKLDLLIKGHNTELLERSISYNSVLIYNKLSHEIIGVKCITKFKKIHFTWKEFLFWGIIYYDYWSLFFKHSHCKYLHI